MRSDDEICRRARESGAAQVSRGARTGPRASRAGSQSPCGRNRSDTRGARGRHCRISQYPDSKSRFSCRTNRSTAWKDSCTNHQLYRAALRCISKNSDSNRHFEQITESKFNSVFRRSLVSGIGCLSQPDHVLKKFGKTAGRGFA